MRIADHVSLRDISWFQTGGITEYYVECETLDELLYAISRSQELKIPYRVIGESSNVLMSDSGFPGIVIKNKTSSIVFMHDRSQVIVDAGIPLSTLITRASSLGYSGLEFLAGIPGTIGGAVYGNTGVYDYYIGDYVRSATLLFVDNKKVTRETIRRVGREWFEFSPYQSKLKQSQTPVSSQSTPIILSVTLQLCRMNYAKCLEKINSILRTKKEILHFKLPTLQAFSNLHLSSGDNESIQRKNAHAIERPLLYVDKNKVRHWRKGEVAITAENPNFITNLGYGTSKDAADLIASIESEVATDQQPIISPLEYVGLWE